MANTVIALKKSSTPSAEPSDLANGELAINYSDGVIFYKHANGTIVSFGGGQPNYFGTVNANNTLVVADTPNDVLTLLAGTNIVLSTDPVNDTITISAVLESGGDPGPAFNQANTARDHANAAFAKANAALANTSGTTFDGVLNVSENVTTQGLNVTSNVITFGTAMQILPNGMIMIFGDINMLG